MRFLVDLCELAVLLCVAPILAWRSWRTGKYRTDWDQRRGHLPDLPPSAPGQPRIWIHAVSVGEMNAVRGLIQKWHEQRPQTQVVLSCTTDTGIARARELFPDLTIIRYPLDLSRFVRRALDRIKPDLIVLVELEVWFNFVTLAATRGIPVAVINGRLSQKSLRCFSKIGPVTRRMFGALAWVGTQDETYAQRFRQLGVPPDRVTVTGSLKWETAQIADTIPGATELANAMGIQLEPEAQASGSRETPAEAGDAAAPEARPRPKDKANPIWVCGSTGPGEEEIILQVLSRLRHPSQPDESVGNVQLVLVPRKPERFDEVARLVEQQGFTCVRRSQCPDGTSRPYDDRAVQLVDTMGELRKVYSFADVVFVGRSLVPMGGSDMMEVAALGKPIIVGPHTSNFRDAMEQLRTAGAVAECEADASKAKDAIDNLYTVVFLCLIDDAGSNCQGASAREVVRKNLGATQRTLDGLLSLVPERPCA